MVSGQKAYVPSDADRERRAKDREKAWEDGIEDLAARGDRASDMARVLEDIHEQCLEDAQRDRRGEAADAET